MGCWTYGNRVGVSRWSLVSSFREGLGVRSLLVVRFCVIGWLNVSVKLCVFCYSVLFCEKKNAPTLWDIAYEICWGGLSLTELTDPTEPFGARFELTERLRHTENTEASPPTPLRMERGVVCEVTPFGLLLIGNGPLNIWRTWRGISVITPLSIRRGAGGEASVGC